MRLKGCGTALVTPFCKGGAAVDYDKYDNLVARQVEAGIDFLVPLGTTAETPCLSAEEKCQLLRRTVALSGGRPVVAGCGTNSLAATIDNMRLLEPCGPDAFLVVTPYYNKPTQEGLYEYFKAVAESTGKGIVLYNVPGRTGVNLSAETCLRLAEIENVWAVKEASGNLGQIFDIICQRPKDFGVLSGNDDQTLPLMAGGADGVISVVSNVAPVLMKQLTEALSEDNMALARELNARILPLCKACFCESNPIPAKAALSLMGLCEADMRLPLTTACESTFRRMESIIDEYLPEGR